MGGALGLGTMVLCGKSSTMGGALGFGTMGMADSPLKDQLFSLLKRTISSRALRLCPSGFVYSGGG